MSVQIDDLRPYKSLILAKLTDGSTDTNIVADVIVDYKNVLGFNGESNLQVITEESPHDVDANTDDANHSDTLSVAFLHYEEERAPSWYAGDEEIKDRLNHLVVACQRQRHVAIYLSDSRRRSTVTRCIKRGEGSGLGKLGLIDSGLLNAAFVTGPTRTVWLSGIHTRASVKADSKILAGSNLRDALDPLGDQTYYFTAARSKLEEFRQPVGVSPRGSRIWVGATRSWQDFIDTVAHLLRYLETTTKPEPAPLPIVAVQSTKAPNLSEAFEFHFLPPELLADDPTIDEETREMMERWCYHADFEITSIVDDTIEAAVTLDGAPFGNLTLELDASQPTNVKITSTHVQKAPGSSNALAKELEQTASNTKWIKIWYESGHTIADGAIYEIRHRDHPFLDYEWVDLGGHNLKQEKFWKKEFPANAQNLIGTCGSLFCWVKNVWPGSSNPSAAGRGWLACDDGAGEIADFVHLDDHVTPPVLCLIHVKAAKSNSTARKISVASYEVVTGQAVKNLRYLDRTYLGTQLHAGSDKLIGKLVWHNGVPETRAHMINALASIGASYQRSVVVLQPHVRKTMWNQVRADPNHSNWGRLRQLDTLLLATQASCRDLGAEFRVVADAA